MSTTEILPSIFGTIFAALPFIGYAIVTILFVIYSIWGLYHLENYGYVGDATHKVRIIYITASSMIIAATIIILIII